MPVPALSQLPPFLSNALRDDDDDVRVTGEERYMHTSRINSSRGAIASSNTNSHTTRMMDATIQKSQVKSSSTTTMTKAGPMVSSSTLLLVPPLNFDMVCSGGGSGAIYRSGHPNERNYSFMSNLHLKSIVYLSSDDIRPNLQNWIDGTQSTVKLLHFRLQVNKEPFAEMDEVIVADALRAILDRRNLPALVHCNKGKYRVGVVTALIRRMQGWSITSIFDEYARFAGSDRVADEEFIDMFPLDLVKANVQHAPDWLPLTHAATKV